MSEVRYAGFWIRFLASFLDTLFLALPVAIFIYILSNGEWFDFTIYQQNLQMAINGNPNALNSQPQTSMQWEVAFELVTLVITIIFWRKFRGATPGKKFVNIKVVDAKTFKEINNKQAITRSIGYIASTLPIFFGFILIALRKDKRSLHDLLADTVVIYG